jgi:hypothetical protein
MSKFGWSYPAGCTRLPWDDVPDPSPESEKVLDILEAAGTDQTVIDTVCKIVDDLAWRQDHCPTCEHLADQAEFKMIEDLNKIKQDNHDGLSI